MDTSTLRHVLGPHHQALIIGAGRSGIAAARILLKKGMSVTLLDDNPIEQLKYFQASNLKTEPNLHTFFATPLTTPLSDFAAIIISPGVDPKNPLVQRAAQEKIPILSEIDVAYLFLPRCSIIGITGTNGKSTTTVMMESILRAAGKKAIACGNLGRPLSDVVLHEANFDHIVLELSSFQLDASSFLELDHAIIVNISPDHLDRYPDFAAYKGAKLAIGTFLKPNGTWAINRDLANDDIPVTTSVPCFLSGFDYGQGDLAFLEAVAINGEHNRENAVFVAFIAKQMGIPNNAIVEGLRTYQCLPHRCEVVHQKNGITFINDSKGTTVVAVSKALSLYDSPTHLLLGGIDKGEDFSMLNRGDFPHIKGFYVYGRAQEKIMGELNDPLARQFNDMTAAFHEALVHAQAGDVVLLSPGCASYDQFDDYQHRGEVFKALARAVT